MKPGNVNAYRIGTVNPTTPAPPYAGDPCTPSRSAIITAP